MKTEDRHFFDEVARELHDRSVYDILKNAPRDISSVSVQALLESLDDHDLDLIGQCTDWRAVLYRVPDVKGYRESLWKVKNVTHRPNYPFAEVLDDYVNRVTGKVREARRQLHMRFDGLDHDHQEAVMMAFMSLGTERDRRFVYEKLGDEDSCFWTDDYIPLVEKWWEEHRDTRMAGLVVKRCPREYIMEHLEELEGHCSYSTLCLKTGMRPVEGRLPYPTYLYVLMKTNATLGFWEGEEIVLKWVRKSLYEDQKGKLCDSIFEIPKVSRMMFYLGVMGRMRDIMALESFDIRMRRVPRAGWAEAVIRAIEEEFTLPEYIFDCIE